MSKTLIIEYLPRGERSKTKLLVDQFKSSANGKTEIEVLNLVEDTPKMFLSDNLLAYIMRDMVGQDLPPEQEKLLASMDKYTQQLLSADNVVLAFPMFNFSFPAVVKAWFDSVMLKGKTWDLDDNGYVGLLKDKKALVLSTSGGIYNEELGTAGWEHAFSLGVTEFGFMGFETDLVTAQGMNMLNPEDAQAAVENAKDEVKKVVKKWFN